MQTITKSKGLLAKLKLLAILFAFLLINGESWGQVNISTTTPYTQDFDGIGITATAALPTGWKIENPATERTVTNAYTAVATNTTTYANAYNVAMSTTASNGKYNFGGATATDRAVGGISSSSASKSVNIFLQLTNNGSSAINNFTISYDVERYRNGTNAVGFSIRFYYSTTGLAGSWTEVPDFLTSFVKNNDNIGSTTNPIETKSVTNKTLSQALAVGDNIYLAWSYSVTSGTTTSNAQALGIDNISIIGNGGVSVPTVQASGINFTNATAFGMQINWASGDGANRAVFVKEAAGAITNPVNGSTYTPSSDWNTKGTQLGTSGYYCVYNGTGNSVSLTNLTQNTAYYVQIFEYNGTGASSSYYAATATNNPNNQTTLVATSPLITLTPTSPSLAFGNVIQNVQSAKQTFTVSGANLSNNIEINAPVPFKIKLSTDIAYTQSIILNQVAGNVGNTDIDVIFEPTAIGAKSDILLITSTGAGDKQVSVNGIGIKNEPTNNATGFQATTGTPSYNAIILGWTDATGGIVPDGYLIKGSATSFASITAPIDGTPVADGTLIKNVTQGTGIYEFTGLTGSTTYYFKIFPYTNSGSIINFKTDGTVPEISATTTLQPLPTYTWNVATGNWNTPSSWTPDRTTPLSSDILIFDGVIQANPIVTLDFATPQSIGALRIINNANVSFATSAAARTLNIGYTGTTAPQMEITSGSTLTVSAANAVNINVTTGFIGSISGNIVFQNAAHRLIATDASGITFNSTSTFTAGTGFSGNAFGTTSLNSIIFGSGSTYLAQAGSNPFGATQPNSAVIFQSGSLFKVIGNVTPAFSGRTYSNVEIDAIGLSIASSGTSAVSIDNLTITNGTFNINMTGIPGHSIKGNINVASGASLTFSPSSDGTINLNGASLQSISGSGIIKTNSKSNITVNNTFGININDSLTIGGTLTLTNGVLNLGANITLDATSIIAGTPSVTSMIIPNTYKVFKIFNPTNPINSVILPLGETSKYLPVSLNINSATYDNNNYIGVKMIASKNPLDLSIGNYLNRYWKIESAGITAFSCNTVFQYDVSDIVGNESLILCKNFSANPIGTYDVANVSLHQLTANGITEFGSFGGGEILSTSKTLNLTLLLEGLFNGVDGMNPAQGVDIDGNTVAQFGATIADQIAVELYDPSDLTTPIEIHAPVNLNIDGTCSVDLSPSIQNASYYIVIKHRNSIETWSNPVLFTNSNTSYDFTTNASQAYENNLKSMNGVYVIYVGDPNQDGFVDITDLSDMDNDLTIGTMGYNVYDLNGDGFVDITDLSVIDNNLTSGIYKITP